MILLLPNQSEQEARAELAAIREAGKHITSSHERRRRFLACLGFGLEPKAGKGGRRKAASKSAKGDA